ncbi:hypothetical protein [Pantoea sp. 18069]|uniref:hypothetical protein n=1 Tax=Pantoea sp. 18069 TaxID=2681415 RepID=UPI00135A9596|nr:hypothetical protein [Pantoea sp. 18069]
MIFLRFESRAEALGAFALFVEDGSLPIYIGTVAVDDIGRIYRATGEGKEIERTPLPGYHVNLTASIPELADWEIPAPANPARVFAIESEPLRVPQEVSMAQCRLALFDQHNIQTDEQFFALVDLLPEAERARAVLELRTRPTVRRDNALVVLLGDAMGWDLDALFVYAEGI